jgi:hypothetical protein
MAGVTKAIARAAVEIDSGTETSLGAVAISVGARMSV